MNRTMREHLTSVTILIVYLLLNGCAAAPIPPLAYGQVEPMTQQATITGIYSVLNGSEVFGEVWVKGGHVVISWPQSQGWAWACLNFKCTDPLGNFRWTAGGQANIGNWQTWSDMANFLKGTGWQKLTREVLPTAVTAGETVGGFLSQMAGAITGFMFVPFPLDFVPMEGEPKS